MFLIYKKCPYFGSVQSDDMQSKSLRIWEMGAGQDPAQGTYTSQSMACCHVQQNMPCWSCLSSSPQNYKVTLCVLYISWFFRCALFAGVSLGQSLH